MIPATYNLPTGYRGDTYGPIYFYFNDISGNAIDLNGADGTCQVKTKPNGCAVIDWRTSNSTMGISGNQVFLAPVSGENMKIAPQNYIYDLELTLSGITQTYINGILPISGDISNY